MSDDKQHVEIREAVAAALFNCQECGEPLARSLNRRLFVVSGEIEVTAVSARTVRLRCPRCKTPRIWNPAG